MNLKTVFVRFYKSFNDDFLEKNKDNPKKYPWDLIDGKFHPYIKVSIEPQITTIVGANESGKSHLLSAIEKAISGKQIERSDFCRYSPFFTVKQGELKYPDFGVEWANLLDEEKENIRKIIDIPVSVLFDSFFIFRNSTNRLTIYLYEKEAYRPYKVENEKSDDLQNLLPNIFRIQSDVALPSCVPIKKLVKIGEEGYSGGRKFEFLEREDRIKIVEALDKFTGDAITKVRPHMTGEVRDEIDSTAVDSLRDIIKAIDEGYLSTNEKEKREKEFHLAYKLICKIAQVDIKSLEELAEAIRSGRQGYANGIIEKINRQLSINLNFPNYWVQDRNFSLKVMARDYDLVFTITDRTGTEYSFDERSQGLRYFLSYFIQYRSHEPHPSKSEILLMDEPDAYLSSQAQQDLLKIFDLFVNPELSAHLTKPIQVIYVTHSPFLIDKNHAERIRVLQKGTDDEGTRVVRDAARNHYEPLRSSIGGYVGESTFIGNCNLMVEGLSDQIIIAGVSTYLQSKNISGLETLDLNKITIVPSGSASHIPYLVYLAHGRDVEKPSVIVLLDSDDSGNEAKRHLLAKGGQHRRPLLKEKFILKIADIRKDLSLTPNSTTEKMEIEDLIPLPICLQATRLYLKEFFQMDDEQTLLLNEKLIQSDAIEKTVLDKIEEGLKSLFDEGVSVNKVGFARNVIQVVHQWNKEKDLSNDKKEALQNFEKNIRSLFRQLNSMQRNAEQRNTGEKLVQKIDRLKNNFNASYPSTAKREHAVTLLEAIANILDANEEKEFNQEIDAIRACMQNLHRVYELDIEMNQFIDNFDQFKADLEKIQYAGLLSMQEEDVKEIPPQNMSEEVSETVPRNPTTLSKKAIQDELVGSSVVKNTDTKK